MVDGGKQARVVATVADFNSAGQHLARTAEHTFGAQMPIEERHAMAAKNPAAEHRVVLTGHPNLTVTVHGTEPGEPGAAGGGNASAANRIVNAIPAVCAAPAGPVSPVDLPAITGARQMR